MPNWNDVLDEIRGRRAKSPLDEVRQKYLRQLADHTGRNVIAYYSGWLSTSVNSNAQSINDEDKNGFMSAVHRLDKSKGLDLILHTPGGGVAAAESLVHYLRQMFGTNIRAIVPQMAMSAGTMIACACHSIVMGKESNLGPIDPQLGGLPAHGVLDEFETAFEEIKQDPSRQLVWQPILQKYHPTFLGECKNAIDMADQIVREWLESGMFAEEDDGKQRADAILERLGSHKETLDHARHLHLDDCEAMGLKIERLENDPDLQDLVLTVHHAYMHTIGMANVLKIVENHEGQAVVLSAGQLPNGG